MLPLSEINVSTFKFVFLKSTRRICLKNKIFVRQAGPQTILVLCCFLTPFCTGKKFINSQFVDFCIPIGTL